MYNLCTRKYIVKYNGKEHQITGGFSFGDFNAAVKFTKDNIAGFEVIPGGQLVKPNLRRFEVINYDLQIGDVLWVTEI